MTTDMPNHAFDFDQVDEDRLSQLFTLAIAQHKSRSVDLSRLSAEDEAILSEILRLLQAIDASWESAPSELARGRAIFLKKLAAEEPNHPWVRQNEVATLGDLFRESQEEFPLLPQAAVATLSKDPTPIENLLDVSQRTEVLGKALKTAAVPTKSIRDLVMGINRILGAVSAISRPHGQSFVYARRQRPTKLKSGAPEIKVHDDE